MNVAISQPMLFPWVGLLEQIRLANIWVHYADVQFSKGSFTNRVQIKTSKGVRWLTVPLERIHLGQRIDEVRISNRMDWRNDHLRILSEAYASAPFRREMLQLVESTYAEPPYDIGSLATSSTMALCRYFGLAHSRHFLDSRDLGVSGSGSGRVLGIVTALGADRYITGHGASNYLDHEMFEHAGIRVEYLDYKKLPYPQLHGDFTPYVSSLDLVANMGQEGKARICSGSIYWRDFVSHERNR